jgi:hypothetical protein
VNALNVEEKTMFENIDYVEFDCGFCNMTDYHTKDGDYVIDWETGVLFHSRTDITYKLFGEDYYAH